MARARVGYLLALMGAGAFFLFFNGYFSLYILVLALVFPVFSLLVSLPGIKTARVSFAVSDRAIRRGESFALSLKLRSGAKLPVGRVKVRIRCTNLLTGETSLLRRKAAGGSLGLSLTADVTEAHCGLVQCELVQLKVCDLLGIFSFRLPLPEPLTVLSLPLNLPPEEVPMLLGEGEQNIGMKPRPGGGPGEDYDLRPYRQGDPLRSVHWKLSSKVDGLIVRETLEPIKVQAVLTYNHYGSPDELDRIFDRLDAVSRGLIERERTHSVQWADPVSGALMTKTVSNQNDLRAFEHAAFGIPAPREGQSILAGKLHTAGSTALLRHLHVALEHEEVETA